MRPFTIAIGIGIAGVVVAVCYVRLRKYFEPPQSIKLTEQRHAELLDEQRRQNYER